MNEIDKINHQQLDATMALDYRYFEEHNLVVMTGTGNLTAEDFKNFISDYLCKDPKIKPGFIELGDMRKIERNMISQADMLEIVKLEEISNRPQPSRLAFVVSNDAEYGAARQYASHSVIKNKTVEVFRSLDEAKSWLGIAKFTYE